MYFFFGVWEIDVKDSLEFDYINDLTGKNKSMKKKAYNGHDNIA